jgi:adenylylsulfate kinase
LTNVIWLMGPTSAGKTTLAKALVEHLRAAGDVPVIHWDGDQVRDMLGTDLDFSSNSRLRVVRTLAEMAKATSDAGVFTIVSALTAHEDARKLISEILPRLIICYVHCPIDICIERDPKGLYRRAIDGEIDTLIGYNSEYRPPIDPALIVDTSLGNVAKGVEQIVAFLAGADSQH